MEVAISRLNRIFYDKYGDVIFALDIPSTAFRYGEVVGLIGRNGSGKSLFGKLLSEEDGLIFNSQNTTDPDSQTKAVTCGLMRQRAEDSLAGDLTVMENVLIRMSLVSIYDRLFVSRLRSRIKSLLAINPELEKKIDEYCVNLSVGQRQALAFISVMCAGHRILFLDEFFASADMAVSNNLRGLARDYAISKGAVVFVVSHDLDMVLNDTDRILVLERGLLKADFRRGDPLWNRTPLYDFIFEGH